MKIKDLKIKAHKIIGDLKDHGIFPKENDSVEYKKELTITGTENGTEVFLINFAKDIISFANADGGIVLIGINEENGSHEEIGLNTDNVNFLRSLDLNNVAQGLEKITKGGVPIDLQAFQIGTKHYFYLIIEKCNNTLVPISDFRKYTLNKGEIWYRVPGKNEHANKSTANFNQFIRMKANEKNKEFMEIWSKLLPKMIEINPKEVLILNPGENKIYGFDSESNSLAGGAIQIDKTSNNVFGLILKTITAGDIDKITTNKGIPRYRIVGERSKDRTAFANLKNEIQKKASFKFTELQLKKVCHHLGWVNDDSFKIINPDKKTLKDGFENYLWVETTDSVKGSTKIYFSLSAIDETLAVINKEEIHGEVFGRNLTKKL